MKCDIVPTIIYSLQSIKKAQWLSIYPSNYHKLLLSINHGHVENTCYYIKHLIDDGAEVDIIRKMIINFIKPSLIDLGLEMEKEINLFERKWAMRKYDNDLHYLLAFICHLQTPISILNKCNIFVTPKVDDMDFINKVENEPIPLTHRQGIQIYNTLSFKRYFRICDKIGSFKLARWFICDASYAHFLKKNWFHWEYYAAIGCPLWQERLKKCGGITDHDKQAIIFPSDKDKDEDEDETNKEQFYNLYAYEFDEQPKNIQMMSHCELVKQKWQEWYNDVFVEQPLVVLNDDFEFTEY